MARRTGAQTREAIRAAAERLFREQGLGGASVRDIAAAAGTDPALVIRHFGSKELLFLDVVHLTIDAEPLLDVPVERLGARLVEVLLAPDAPTRGVFLALLRGSDQPAVAERLRRSHEEAFVQPLRARLSGSDADLRARLAAAAVAGLLYSAWVVDDPGVVPGPELAARYGRVLQELLDGP